MSTTRFTVFVSYSRADSAFADEIEAGLDYDGGFDVLIDRHDIHEGEDWQSRLGALIAQADTVVFILSRRSAASPICRWEVDFARGLSKRILPIQAEPLGDVEAPPALAALNYVRFDDGRSFMTGLTALRRALKTDIDWLREHTRLLTRAQEWLAANKPDNRLLSGSDVADAKAWLDRKPVEGLQPTEAHRDFIHASDQAETLRLSAERERATKLERAVTQTRKALRVAIVLACVAVVFAGVAGGLWLYASRQRGLAEAAALKARSEEERAKASAIRAEEESQRADQVVRLVSANEAGRRAMQNTCEEAIRVTSTLATTTSPDVWLKAHGRFWELYFASMYIVELHQRKATGSSDIEAEMIHFGRLVDRPGGTPASAPRPGQPRRDLCESAKDIRYRCIAHLQLDAPPPEPCR